MGRGESNLLFGKPILIKKDEDGFRKRFFRDAPEALSFISGNLVFLSDGTLRAVSSLGNERETVFPLELTRFSDDSLLTLTSFGAAWSSKERIFYHSLALDDPIIEIANKKDIVALHLSNKRLYLFHEEEGEIYIKSREIADLRKDDTDSWQDYLADDDTKVQLLYHSAKEAFVFSKTSDGLQVDLLPENGWIKTWRLDDFSEDILTASRIAYFSFAGENLLLYAKDKSIIAFQLDGGGERPLFTAPGKIRDFAISGSRISFLTEDIFAVYDKGHLVRREKTAGQENMILDTGDDIVLWTTKDKGYLILKDE